jgi:hypothetical protein
MGTQEVDVKISHLKASYSGSGDKRINLKLTLGKSRRCYLKKQTKSKRPEAMLKR